MRQAERVILAVDSSKFGRRALVRLASLADIDALVTDRLPDEHIVALLHRHGVSIHC
ncbi:hypothetical protein ACQKGL_02570 [Ensifer adhaerens]|uniref:hypothetical protein n=1 Tax=Ensifer adhaerens TaxID=106592 RepID=UPI003D04F587